MPSHSHSLQVLGMHVSFTAEADHQRVEQAKKLAEKRYHELEKRGTQISRERLLVFLALGLADDLLQANQECSAMQERLQALLAKIDEG
ncbi:cell division protein ZapA [Megalodesulfovibrio paquesii]